MPSIRAIVVACCSAAACLCLTGRDVYAQACTINSTAPGPVSCAVHTTVTMTVRVPTMVGVSVTPGVTSSGTRGQAKAAASVVEAGIGVKANRSYDLQIARAPIDSASITPVPPAVTWSTATSSALLGDTPIRIDQYGSATSDRPPTRLALSRDPRHIHGIATADPIGLLLTIVAP
jgi:hypothetical protein